MHFKSIVITVLISIVFGCFGGWVYDVSFNNSPNKLIKDFYKTENAVKVSPHGLRLRMDRGDTSFVLVDVRSAEEYAKEHITGAYSVPAYTDKTTLQKSNEDRVVNDFRKIIRDNPNREVIIYCYSVPCMTGRRIGNLLAKNGVFVKELNVGWNEWRYYWNLWNLPHEWSSTDSSDYITHGNKRGFFKVDSDAILKSNDCSIGGSLDC